MNGKLTFQKCKIEFEKIVQIAQKYRKILCIVLFHKKC